MPQASNADLKCLLGFTQHGVEFSGENETQKKATCPFCGKAEHFFVARTTALWDCKSCGKSGNFQNFLGAIALKHRSRLLEKPAQLLAAERGLSVKTLRAWNVGWSGGFYTVPIDGNPKRKTTDIHRYHIGKGAMSTTGGHHSLIVPATSGQTPVAWLLEGDWDGMAMWEVLRAKGLQDDVFAVPGANSFPRESLDMFYGRDVIAVYDADAAGTLGAHRALQLLGGIARSIKFVVWPIEVDGGYDFRDFYQDHKRDANSTYADLLKLIKAEPPPQYLPAQETAKIEEASGSALRRPTGEGLPHEEVEMRFRKWLEMDSTEPLDVMFGTIFANRIPGDPVWTFLVAPPGGMKSELLMSLYKAIDIISTTSLTSKTLVSGAVMLGGGDPSLLPKLNGKLLVIKDFTTILGLNDMEKDSIFGTLRDAYDGLTRKDFGNGLVREYHSKFGIVAGATSVIETLASTNAQLGERFLKYRIRQRGNIDVGRKAIWKALANIKQNEIMRAELNATACQCLDYTTTPTMMPNTPKNILERLVSLAQWVAVLRGVVNRDRYTGLVNFKPMHEIGTRLAKQLCKLGMGMAIYKRKALVDENIYRTIVTIAQDTAPDRIEELVKQMFIHDEGDFATTKNITQWTRFPEDTIKFLLQDLALLKVIVRGKEKTNVWRLAPKMLEVMRYLHLYEQEKLWNHGWRRVESGGPAS